MRRKAHRLNAVHGMALGRCFYTRGSIIRNDILPVWCGFQREESRDCGWMTKDRGAVSAPLSFALALLCHD